MERKPTRVVMVIKDGEYYLYSKQEWDDFFGSYRPTKQQLETYREFDLEPAWFRVLHPSQSSLGGQKALKEIYEEWIDGDQARNG